MSWYRNIITVLIHIILLNLVGQKLNAQCSVVSSCGYTVTLHVSPLSIVTGGPPCPFGYNYNVRFRYSVTAMGTNTCSAGTLGVQPQIFCNSGQNNGYYTISNAIPSGAVSVSNTGTLTTTTNPYNSDNDCATATPTSLGCNSLQSTIFGPGLSSSTYGCSGFSNMPIELYDFTSQLRDNMVILKWATASERNNDYFTLERSTDAESWEVIKNVRAAGNSTSRKNYEFHDREFVRGINYYRLKQTDYDGSFDYSIVIYVDALNSDQSVSFFPNPASSEFNIETQGGSAKDLQISNAQGKVILMQTIFESANLNIHDFPQGIYFVKVSEGDKISYFKLVKN